MKKKIILIAVIVVFIVLLFPIPNRLKDGGTVEYKALLYKVTKYYRITTTETDMGHTVGTGIEILGFEIYKNTKYKPLGNIIIEESSSKNAKIPIQNSFVGTILEETTKYMIVEPNEDEEERKSADKIRVNYETDHIDFVYGIGRKVVIKYTGYIMETYPAEITADDILTDGYEHFELSVEKSDNTESKKILNNTELNKYNSDYDLYYYGLNEVNVTVDNKTMPLEQALRSGKVTIEGIISKANRDADNDTIKAYNVMDGGTKQYNYDTYTIIKYHTLDGKRDVYIGTPEMNLTEL